MPKPRIIEDSKSIYSLLDEFLVECPRCARCARIRAIDSESAGTFDARRLVCASCGLSRDWAGNEVGNGPDTPRDCYFHLPIWLQTECCGHTLWAYNLRHLDLLESFVGAVLREHRPHPEHGWSNRSWMNRLPEWITSAKNREDILKAISRLRKRIQP